MKQITTALVSFFLLTGFVHIPEERLVQMQPPPEAFAACAGKKEGAACTIATEGEGVCRTPPGLKERACIPHAMMRARGPGGPGRGGRNHMIIQSDGMPVTRAATEMPVADSRIEITVEGGCRRVRANGIARHKTGPFPNDGNPGHISGQDYVFCLPAAPAIAASITELGLGKFGLGLNGVPFDPGAAEFYKGRFGSPWRYEAISGALDLGFDENFAHVQFTGAYHYHGLPALYLRNTDVTEGAPSPLVGWAADGFPIYALYGAGPDGSVRQMRSSYRLKQGARPESESDPGGTYDGTFVGDYEYVPGLGDLDQCNGRTVQTTDFPNGTYAYFLTEEWPVIPRCFRGTPDPDFIRMDPPPGRNRPPRRERG